LREVVGRNDQRSSRRLLERLDRKRHGISQAAHRIGGVAHKNKLLQAAVRMYVELAHYVEANCNDDLATFLLSGFQPASSTKTPPQPLDQPSITVEPGPVTGQMKAKIGSVPKALSYHLHYAPVPSGGGAPATWTDQIITST